MPLEKPYPHVARGQTFPANFICNEQEARVLISAFFILKRDLIKVFEYIEPTSDNLGTYSHRTLEILLRSCIEVEGLAKIVFTKNHIHLPKSDRNIIRYSDLNGLMRLSEYEVALPGYQIPNMRPFSAFSETSREKRSPFWYKEYNKAKHDRLGALRHASLGVTLEAMAGAYVLLSAQIGINFDSQARMAGSGSNALEVDGETFNLGFITMSDSYDLFEIVNSPVWSPEEKYGFKPEELPEDDSKYNLAPIPKIP